VVGKSSSAGSVRDSNGNWFSHPPGAGRGGRTAHGGAPLHSGSTVLLYFFSHRVASTRRGQSMQRHGLRKKYELELPIQLDCACFRE